MNNHLAAQLSNWLGYLRREASLSCINVLRRHICNGGFCFTHFFAFTRTTVYVFKNFYYPEKRIFWIYEKPITCSVVLACYVQRGGCTQSIYSEFSRSDLGSGQKRMKVKISIYLNNMITCLRLRLRATLHGQDGPGIPLSIKMHVIDAVKETCQGNLTKYQDAHVLVLPVEISST